MMKQPAKTFISFLLAASLFVGCYTPSLDMVEVKALFVSADILNKNPLLNHYLDIAKLAEYIVTSFYIKQSVEKGKIPKKASDNPFGSHSRTDNRMGSFSALYEFKDISDNLLLTGNFFCLATDVWLPDILCDRGRCDPAVNYMLGNEECIIALLNMSCFIAPRSDVSDLIVKTNIS
jgi:hypothetical protein